MTATEKGKVVILVLGAVFFACGVWAVSMDRTPLRAILLGVAFAGLMALAVRQTVVRLKNKGN